MEQPEKRLRMNSFLTDFGRPAEVNRVFSQDAVEESRSLFHCYISEVDHLASSKRISKTKDNGILIQQTVRNPKVEVDPSGFAKFNIPNFVTTDQNSSADEDLIIYDPPIILENHPTSSNQNSFIN
ncbi:unnamed protein product [Staurois parvus]|uniref:Uncharacterized protein n=1 Tax=Staurois parvus TaxID=386267 RepID=A0ABN9DXI2_9NEOB|nr:unnamed protein product [Staurois parvus]